MTLSPQEESDLRQVHDAYWSNYLKGKVEAMIPLLDDHYTQIGSAESEVFSNKKDAVQFLVDTIHQVADQLEMRNRNTTIEANRDHVLVRELADVYVLIEETWTFYAKFRATTLMHQVSGEWKIFHQHSSFADARAEEGQNIAIEKIAAENSQLREAVRRRTIELEHKNRDLEIESALEKVRSIAMSMQEPDDMLKVCRTISDQLNSLGVKEIRNVQTAIIYESKGTYVNFEYYAKHDKDMVTEVHYDNHQMSIDFVNRMLQDPNGFYTSSLNRDELLAWFNFQKTTNQFVDTYLENADSLNYYWNSAGPVALGISTYQPLRVEEVELFKRFRNVFGLAYRRYLDIEIAQAQAREARIELALERVRARTMAMQRSEEMVNAALVLFKELKDLGIEAIRTGLATVDAVAETVTVWSSQLVAQHDNHILGVVPKTAHPFWNEYLEAWKKKAPWLCYTLVGEDVKSYYAVMSGLLSYPLQKEFNAKETFQMFYFPEGSMNVVTQEPLSEESCQLLVRFARVFGLIYRRFLDLKQAEVQAREAQIEASLERVRSRTMGMQRSDELPLAANLLFQQIQTLGMPAWSAGYCIWDEDKRGITLWMSSEGVLQPPFKAPLTEDPSFIHMREAHERGETFYTEAVGGEDLVTHYQYMRTLPVVGEILDSIIETGHPLPIFQIFHLAYFSQGFLLFITYQPVPEAHDIFRRFGKVFDQTYTRFLDLQKAEAQAREAQIETALERVRSRTMAMQVSDELKEVIRVVFEQMMQLNIHVQHAGFIMDYKENDDMDLWIASAQTVPGRVRVPFFDSPHWNSFNDAKEKGIDFFANHLDFEAKNKFYKTLFTHIPDIPEADLEYFFTCPGLAISTVLLDNIGLYIENFSGLPYSADENAILMRFGKVFQQTYTRFHDLQKAEAQAKESQIEAALERVRSRTLAMQKSDELAETAAVLFRQLISLGIKPNRLYISIIKDEHDAEFWITDEDGSRVSTAFHTDMLANPTFKKMFDGWKEEKKILILNMHGKELEDYFRHLNSINVPFKGGLEQKRRVQHIAYFSKGFIGMAAPEEQPAETMQLLERFASVFNLTFTRFNDLIAAEQHAKQAEEDLHNLIAEKKRTEEALHDLRNTQAQLIQAEKMASLGQLTAGIAHEIQNPLNFVNNFSEVNSELIDELGEELAKGNLQLANEIARDIKDNEEKIVFHGKRADAIVKSMLQHSRTGSGQKELTDINAMADEYLRLAYHGMRAKDKSFNVDFKTELDPQLPKINVMPQEIGRVLLNLINNAFQALASAPYPPEGGHKRSPTVKVGTKYIPPLGGRGQLAEISISDNGPGIPDSIKDKIFQPFFTTKPTGQGTGLGLSLSYDIIKAHGGELKVETTEGEGTTFIIQLPV